MGDLLEKHMEIFRNRLMENIYYVPRMLRALNDSATESIVKYLRLAHQGLEMPSPSTDHGVADILMGDTMIQAITTIRCRLLTRSTILTHLADQFLESNYLVHGVTDLKAQKKGIHITIYVRPLASL